MTLSREPSVGWDALFAAVLGFFLFMTFQSGFKLGPIEKGPTAVFLGAYIQCWGAVFVLSYFFSDRSYLLKGIMWLCENISHPRGRWTAVLWGVFAIAMGTICMLQGLGFRTV